MSARMKESSLPKLPTRDHGVVGDAGSAHAVVSSAGHLSGAASAVAVEPVVGVPRVRVGVIAAEVVARPGILHSYVHRLGYVPLILSQLVSFLFKKEFLTKPRALLKKPEKRFLRSEKAS